MSKTLLIVGAGREQIPAIRRAKEQGLTVAVTDFNPDAPGRPLADAFFLVSTGDAEGTLAAARQLEPDGVMTLSSETGVPTVAAVTEALGLPGFSCRTALLATDKLAMKKAFVAHGVPTTPFAAVRQLNDAQDFCDHHGLPAVIKPAVNSGQRGTTLITTRAQITPAVAEALEHAPDGRAIIEEFAPGPEINVTGVVGDRRVDILSISERVTAQPPHFGIATAHAAPMPLTPMQNRALIQAVEKAVDAIGLRNGVVYPQFIMTDDGPRLLEIAIRIPGGFMREVARLLSGIDLIDVVIAQALGSTRPMEEVPKTPSAPALVVQFVTALDANRILARPDPQKCACIADMPGIEEVHWHLDASTPIPSLEHSGARFGAVIAIGDSRAQAQARADDAIVALLQ